MFTMFSYLQSTHFSQMLVAVSLATRAKKRAILIGNLQGFLIFRKKGLVCKAPHIQGRGGECEPQETQKGPNPCIFTVFSCLQVKSSFLDEEA